MTCYTNCLHCDVCKRADSVEYKDAEDMKADCPHFKNKADFVEVKYGKWLNNGTICSNCKQINPTLRLDMENEYVGAWLEYCPNCGAKMHSQL